MAQRLGEPVALICTSGSALLNYGPAAAEAFYQHIPLLFISADRPVEWIDQGIGQTIRQSGALIPHVKKSIQLPQEPEHQDDQWHCQRLINEAVDELTLNVRGPVHVNIPFREPLYGTTSFNWNDLKIITQLRSLTELEEQNIRHLADLFNGASRVMIMVGQHEPAKELQPLLTRLVVNHDVVVLTESTSNVDGGPFHGCIDRLLPATRPDKHRPDLLISFGGPIISKRIIQLLQSWKMPQHWRIGTAPRHFDTFQSLTHDIDIRPEEFFAQLIEKADLKEPAYSEAWRQLDEDSLAGHDSFIEQAPFCDLTVMKTLLECIPAGSDIHWANSTPIRYSQLFVRNRKHRHYSNRGTSGIDGCTSTAAGFAHASGTLTTLVTGDIAFLYDTNGLWSHHVSAHLKIILIDNGGGNIFKYINGPDTTDELEEFFVTKSSVDPGRIAHAYGLEVFKCSDESSLRTQIDALYMTNGPAILVVTTDPELSPVVLRDYFKALSHG
jgi:2-succinyl-5-enolpyruvyl-6-hydroxy-3-cyclohexene-1-carboxylate synthase